MKYFLFLAFTYSLTICLQGCSSTKALTNYASNYRYEYDTISRIFNTDFTKGYTGGIDVICQDSNTYVAYNFCKTNEIKILDYANNTFVSLPQYNPKCDQIYTAIKNNDVYVTTRDNKVYLYCDKNREKELVVDLMQIDKFKQSGLVVEWNKRGGDQHVNVSDKVIFFRLHQNFDDTLGLYSKMDSEYPAFAKLELQTKEIDFYGKLPHFMEYSEYGFISNYYDLYNGDDIITSTSINGKIEIIHTLTKTVVNKNVTSRFDNVPIKKIKYPKDKVDVNNVKMRHYLITAYYEPLFYNPYTHYYYRIFHPTMNEFNDKGLLNTEQDKKCVLMIMNENFELIDEVLLPVQRSMILKLYPVENGVQIFLPEISELNEHRSEFKFLKIKHFK